MFHRCPLPLHRPPLLRPLAHRAARAQRAGARAAAHLRGAGACGAAGAPQPLGGLGVGAGARGELDRDGETLEGIELWLLIKDVYEVIA